MRIIFLIILLGLTLKLRAQVQVQGKGWLRLSESITSSDSYFGSGPNSEKVIIRTNSYYITALSSEYGINNRLTIFGSLPFVRVVVNERQYNQSGISEPGGALNSLGDADAGIKYALRNKLPVRVIGFISFGIPLGRKGDITSEANLQTGDGEFNQLIGFQLQHEIGKFFISGYASFNNRLKEYSNEIRYGLEAAYLSNSIQVKARYQAIESLFNESGINALNGVYSNHREVFYPGIEFTYNLSEQIGIFSSVDFIIAGRNTLTAPVWSIGIQIKRK